MITESTPATLHTVRRYARDLLNEFDSADGLACYYALFHDSAKTTLYVHRNEDGQVDGILSRAFTGIDLFRPLISLRLRGNNALDPLLNDGLTPNRPYLMVLPESHLERVKSRIALTDISLSHILRLEPQRYRPERNVLVVQTVDPAGYPKAEIRNDAGDVIASSGVNWSSPIFSEVYVHVTEQNRFRGLGRSVVNAVVGDLLQRNLMPLYTVGADNSPSLGLAEAVGFVDTGAREVMAQAVREVDE